MDTITQLVELQLFLRLKSKLGRLGSERLGSSIARLDALLNQRIKKDQEVTLWVLNEEELKFISFLKIATT